MRMFVEHETRLPLLCIRSPNALKRERGDKHRDAELRPAAGHHEVARVEQTRCTQVAAQLGRLWWGHAQQAVQPSRMLRSKLHTNLLPRRPTCSGPIWQHTQWGGANETRTILRRLWKSCSKGRKLEDRGLGTKVGTRSIDGTEVHAGLEEGGACHARLHGRRGSGSLEGHGKVAAAVQPRSTNAQAAAPQAQGPSARPHVTQKSLEGRT